jgi:hypothetical protein
MIKDLLLDKLIHGKDKYVAAVIYPEIATCLDKYNEILKLHNDNTFATCKF